MQGYNGVSSKTNRLEEPQNQTGEDLFNIKNNNNKEQVTPLVVTFYPNLPLPTGILNQHQYIINTSLRLRGVLPKLPS